LLELDLSLITVKPLLLMEFSIPETSLETAETSLAFVVFEDSTSPTFIDSNFCLIKYSWTPLYFSVTDNQNR